MVKDIQSLNLYSARLSGYDIIYLNLQAAESLPFFQEAPVRQALLAALDRQAMINEALHGQGFIANGPILPWSWAYNASQETIGYDPARASALLEASGWVDSDGDGIRDKGGQSLAFSLLTSDDPGKIAIAEMASAQWQAIGVAAGVEIIGANLGARLVQHDFQAALAEVLLAGDPDPYPLWHQTQIEGGQNYAGWNNTEASMLLETARTQTDEGLRNDAYFEFQRLFAAELPSLILFHPVYSYGVSQEVYNVRLEPLINPSDRFRTVTDWYLLTRRVIYNQAQFQ
jgi:peptide/nickel transport system substrate-binding protein